MLADLRPSQLVCSDLHRIWAEVELANGGDIYLFREGLIKEQEIRHITVNAVVSSSSHMLAITQNIKFKLGLPVIELQVVRWAWQGWRDLEVVGPVEISFQGRSTMTRAIVLPESSDSVLGTGPMRSMELVLDLECNQLVATSSHCVE